MFNPKKANRRYTVDMSSPVTKKYPLPGGGILYLPEHHYRLLVAQQAHGVFQGIYHNTASQALRVTINNTETVSLYKHLYPCATHCQHIDGNPLNFTQNNLILSYPDTAFSSRRAVDAQGVPVRRQTRPNLPIPSLPTDKPSTVRLSAKSSAAGFDSFVVDADTWELLQELFNSGMATPATIRLNGHGRETVFISVDKKQMQLHVFLSNLPRTKFKNYDRMDLRLENLI